MSERIDDLKKSPFWKQSFEDIFTPETAWVVIGKYDLHGNSHCEAFAYANGKYGYIAITTYAQDEQAKMVEKLKEAGFAERKGYPPGFYSLPNAKWWTDSPENFVQVDNA